MLVQSDEEDEEDGALSPTDERLGKMEAAYADDDAGPEEKGGSSSLRSRSMTWSG